MVDNINPRKQFVDRGGTEADNAFRGVTIYKYTKALQTVHNIPVMKILKGCY